MQYKLLGLYVIFFIIIFLIDNFVVINKIYSDSKQPYRLGDSLNGNCPRTISKGKECKYPTGYHLHKYKYSISADYMRKTDKDRQYNIVNNIVKKRSRIRHKLYDNYINIHLRTGDVFSSEKNRKTFTKNISYYEKVIKYLKKNNINNKKVLIITGWHIIRPKEWDKHKKYNWKDLSLKHIEDVKKLFEKNGYHVTTRLNEDSDEDFIIMSNSKYFVQSGGGYSRLIGKMVDLNGNTVINEKTLK